MADPLYLSLKRIYQVKFPLDSQISNSIVELNKMDTELDKMQCYH